VADSGAEMKESSSNKFTVVACVFAAALAWFGETFFAATPESDFGATALVGGCEEVLLQLSIGPVLCHSFLLYALSMKVFFSSKWLSGLGRMLSGTFASQRFVATVLPPEFFSSSAMTSIAVQLLMLTLLQRCEKD